MACKNRCTNLWIFVGAITKTILSEERLTEFVVDRVSGKWLIGSFVNGDLKRTEHLPSEMTQPF